MTTDDRDAQPSLSDTYKDTQISLIQAEINVVMFWIMC